MVGRFWRHLSVAVFGAVVLLAPLGAGAGPPGQETTDLRVAQADMAAVSSRIVELTNQARAKGGLPPLQPVPYLTTAATSHSKEMLELNYFSHTSPTPGRAQPKARIQAAQGWDTRIGENIYRAQGVPADALADRAVAAWIKSPSHYKNMMDPSFNSIGIGIVPKGNEFAVTQNFSNQTIVVTGLRTTPGAGGFEVTFKGKVREGSKEGALFVNNGFKEAFTADGGGNFEVRTSAPAGAQLSISQKKPGGNSYAQNLVFPVEAGLSR